MRNDAAFRIIAQYQATYWGLAGHYQLADNLGWLGRLGWVMETSPTKMLVGELRTGVRRIYRRFGAAVGTPAGSRKVLRATVECGEGRRPLVAQWGGIPLRRERHAVLDIRRLADLRTKGQGKKPEWVRVMAARYRKTPVVCRRCHVGIHRRGPP